MGNEINDLTTIQVCRDPTWVGLKKIQAEMIEDAKRNITYDDVIQMLITMYDSREETKGK